MIERPSSLARPGPSLGLSSFLLLWFGQTISLIGSRQTAFALSIWVYQRTNAVTDYALVLLASTLPFVLLAPLVGLVADRFNRRLVMILGDTGAGLSTLVLALLFASGQLSVWHIWVGTVVNAVCSAFQGPAYTALAVQLVPKQQLGRVNGLLQLSQGSAQLIAPILAGALLPWIGMQGIFLIDGISFISAVVTALCIGAAAQPMLQDQASASRPGSLVGSASAAWRYLLARPGLLGLWLVLGVTNFAAGVIEVLVNPLVLSFSTPIMLGLLTAIAGIGMVVGSLAMGVWGGPRRRIYGVLGFELIGGLSLIGAGLRPNLLLLSVCAFLHFFSLPISSGCNQDIFQRKVDPALHGRVFALNGALAALSLTLGYIVAGVLADRVFEPLLATGGVLASSVGHVIGTGPGRGAGFLLIIMGSLTLLAVCVAALSPRMRAVEAELPDTI